METTNNIQSVAERNITMVALASIQPSGYNPRKNFDEASLAELAESIRQQGVLQPIGGTPLCGRPHGNRVRRTQIPCLPHGRVGKDTGCRHGNFGRDSRRDGGNGEPATQGRYAHRGSERLSKAHRERSPRCAVVGGAVRQERELYPHPFEIRLLDTRNRPAFGAGRNHNQRGERNLPLWRGYSDRGVREAPQRRCEV